MSILLNTLSTKNADQIANLGSAGNKHNTPGTHLATITEVYELTAANYSAIIISATINGEDFQHMEFLGKAKDDSQAEIDKANAANERTTAMLARLAKAAGFKDINAAVQSATTETTAKGEKTNFPKFTKKQVNFTTTTEIQPSKDETKAYANQVLNTMKFLDKSGKDAMGRGRLDAFNDEAKTIIEIKYGKENLPVCIQKFNELKEKALGVVATPAPVDQPAATGTMPTAVAQPVPVQAAATVPADDI